MICLFFVYSISSVKGMSPLIVHQVSKGDLGTTKDSGVYDPDRDSKKIVFFNNKAYDLSDDDHRMIWNMYMKKAYVPEDLEHKFKEKVIHTDPNLKKRFDDIPEVEEQENTSIKTSRFVADPDKVHLIETVDSSVLEDKQTTTSSPNSIYNVRDDSTTTSTTTQTPENVETATVFYQATETSILEYLFNELFYNLGSLFTREIFNDVSSVISYIWNSIFYTLSSTARHLIEGRSHQV